MSTVNSQRSQVIYFDNAASAPMRPEAIEAMKNHARTHFANPSSVHAPGLEARKVLEAARAEIAGLLGADAREIVFTSGATEANNLAIRGVLEPLLRAGKKPHVVSTSIEHAAVRETLRDLGKRGVETTFVNPGSNGSVSTGDILAVVRPETVLVSVMAVSNETGAIQPIAEIAAGLKALGAARPVFHTDAVQGIVALDFDAASVGADLASVSAHKIGGPKGAGALYVRRSIVLHPSMTGGGHEDGLRSGTENGSGIAAFAAAAARLRRERGNDREGYAELRRAVIEAVTAEGCAAKPLLDEASSVPNILSLECSGCEADWLVLLLSRAGVMASAGSACTSGTRKASSVLAAMGLDPARARSVIRLSFGPDNETKEASVFAAALRAAMGRRA